jgi:hypothetical protein
LVAPDRLWLIYSVAGPSSGASREKGWVKATEKYLYFVFILILVMLLIAPQSKAGPVISTLGNMATGQIVALQGRGSSQSVLGSVY